MKMKTKKKHNMSAKTVRRSSRSTDESTSQEVPNIAKKDIAKVDTNAECLKSEAAKDDNTAEEGVKTRSQTNSQQNGNSIEDVKQSQENISITNNKANGSDETEIKADVPEVTNSTDISDADVEIPNSDISSNGAQPNEGECTEAIVETRDTAEPEAEPLVLDSEEVELQFDECSDVESQKGSPILSRCRTRRSQTRNIPTPKTPKPVIEQNGDDNADTESNTVSEAVVPSENGDTSEKAETEMEATDTQETESEISVPAEEIDRKCDVINDSFESCESGASTKVNVGSDLTREIDLSYPDRDSSRDPDFSSIRRLSSRRSIRPNADIRKTMLKTRIENQEYTCARSSVEKIIGTKRKNRSETPDGVKRYKVENQQGLLSYIKNRFYPTEVSSSTPKLTGYKKQDIVDDAEISKIENESSPPPEKKWCSIM